MKYAIRTNLQLVIGYRLACGILGIVIIVFIASVDLLIQFFQNSSSLPHGYHTEFILLALESSTMDFFLPILSVLPFAGSYIDDIKSKFTCFFLIRISYFEYVFGRIIVCFISGAMLFIVGIPLAWICAALLFLPMENIPRITSDLETTLFQMYLLMSLNGGFWSVLGIAMSTLMESKYISYATPFVFYYLLVILCERYFSSLFIINPKTWTTLTAWPFGCWGAAIFLLEMTLIFAILFAYRAGRRLQQL